MYLSKAALVKRMLCCSSQEEASQQKVLSIVQVHDLLSAFVTVFNFQDKKFYWEVVVTCCPMNEQRRLAKALTRLNRVCSMIYEALPRTPKRRDLLIEKLKKLRAAADQLFGKLPFPFKYDDDDGAEGPAVEATYELSDECWADALKRVTGPLHSVKVLQRVCLCMASVYMLMLFAAELHAEECGGASTAGQWSQSCHQSVWKHGVGMGWAGLGAQTYDMCLCHCTCSVLSCAQVYLLPRLKNIGCIVQPLFYGMRGDDAVAVFPWIESVSDGWRRVGQLHTARRLELWRLLITV